MDPVISSNATVTKTGFHQDCDGNGIFDDPEIFTDLFADFQITVTAGAPGITLTSYTIEFIPELSNDSVGNTIMPPDLPDITDAGSFTLEIPSGTTAVFSTTCFTVDQKVDYFTRNQTDPVLANLIIARYTVRFTMVFADEFLEERVITESRTVLLGPYDNC